jgi:hypothetical protein
MDSQVLCLFEFWFRITDSTISLKISEYQDDVTPYYELSGPIQDREQIGYSPASFVEPYGTLPVAPGKQIS